jgi:hypothetical protein
MALKFLDYGVAHPFGETIGKPHFLAWPVHAYRVTLPTEVDRRSDLNAFERVILKLLRATGPMETGELAEVTCIPPDLVKSILLRLQDKAIIDEYGDLVGPEHSDAEDGQQTLLFVTALLFRELATGKILPFLHLLDGTAPLRTTESEGRPLCSIRTTPTYENSVPVPRDVIHAWRGTRRRSAAVAGGQRMPVVQQISIARAPEAYLLRCPIAVRKCDGEFRIADPFGNGFSVLLELAFDRVLGEDEEASRRVNQWKRSLSNPRAAAPANPDQHPKEPFENDVNWQRYPKLLAKLRPERGQSFRSLSQIYACLEWALFYVCCRRPFEASIVKLNFTSRPEHDALLRAAAGRIGLVWPQRGVKPIVEGKLLDFKEGKAELSTVLAIAILQAEQDRSHPLNRLVTSCPNCIEAILDIKMRRDAKAHGKGRADLRQVEVSDDAFMRDIVHALLPEIVFSEADPLSVAAEDVRADALLDARTSMQDEFGFEAFNRLGTNLQNRLVQAERFWLACEEGDDASSFADDLYAAVQSAFEKRLAGLLPPDLQNSELINVARAKARDAGLGELPDCLRSVKTLAIRQTLQGVDQTLGACAVALLLMSDAEPLLALADCQPHFLDDMTDIIVKRGHGNEPLPLPKAEIKKLRRAACTTIKTLVGA